MGRVSKRYCARGVRCVRSDPQTGEPEKLSQYNKSDICERCQQEHAAGYRSSSGDRWMDDVTEVLGAFVDETSAARPNKASLWDLFKLDPYNGGWKKYSDRGTVLGRLDAKTLGKLRDWLDKNKDRAVDDYGHGRWASLRADVGFGAWLKQLPPDMYLGPDTEDTLPIQAVAMRTDGKKWDLNTPIRAELLRRLPRYFSERDMAGLLEMPRTTYTGLRDRMKKRGFTLEKFTVADLWAVVHGGRGRKSRSEIVK
jgi:hypothetical protein